VNYDQARHRRRSIRLREYDYSRAGAYFLTVLTQDRACLFGEVVDEEMRLSHMGYLVHQEWTSLPDRFPNIDPDAFIVMPNHIHGIVVITDVDLVGAGLVPAQNVNRATTPGATTRVAPTVGGIVGAFKSITTVRYAHGVKHYAWLPFRGRLWQPNYYEHIIRNEEALKRVRQYIVDTPLCWSFDRENPATTAPEPEDVWAH